MMNFELLPNEILLDLFDYFDDTDLLYAFYGLNFRFNFLLYNQYRTFRFKFNSISKYQFDIICQQHLPFIADRVITLSLCNDDDTPHQIYLFFSYIQSINQFTHLRSLSLFDLHTYALIMKIIDECHQLCHFTHLKFDSCSFTDVQSQFQSIIDNIWTLPKLIHCEIDIIIIRRLDFCAPTKISSSLERLSLIKFQTKSKQIIKLFKYTPCLKHLSISIQDFGHEYLPSFLPALISLNIRIFHTFDISKIICLLENMPNLRRLNIDLLSSIIDGYEWKQIISNYLSKLKIFHFKMKDVLHSKRNIQERMNELIDSFRTLFWTDERRWFVRCFACQTTIYLCTLSNTFQSSECKLPELFISTYPNDDLQSFCNDLTEIFDDTFFDYAISSYIRLNNIKHLTINLSVHDTFWTMDSCLNRLLSLTLFVNADTSQYQLQTLLDRAPYVYKLTIYQDKSVSLQSLKMTLFKCTNTSIRQLVLQECEPYFNEKECLALTHSSFGVQCETLSISVNSRESILNLLYNMSNLRALTIRCKNGVYYNQLSSTETGNEYRNKNKLDQDEVVQWLKERLPLTYIIISRLEFLNTIQIWI